MSNSNTNEEKRPVGRPSTFPQGTTTVAFPTKVSQETLTRLREMAAKEGGRQNPFGLSHNSIGAELHRIVEQAHNRFTKDRERAAAKRAERAESAPAENENS